MFSTLLLDNKILVDNLIKLLMFSFNAYIQVVDLRLEQISCSDYNSDSAMALEPIYKAVLEEKSSVYILAPRKHFVCNDCTENTRCLRKLELAFPIKADGIICGILGIFCYSVDQKNSIYLDIDSSINQINKILSMLEATLDSIVDSKRKNANIEIYRAAAADNGKFFMEFDSGGNIIQASGEILERFGLQPPFSAEINIVYNGIYSIKAAEIEINVKGEFWKRETGSVFLFNIIDESIAPNNAIYNEYTENPPEIIGESEEINKLRSLAMKSAKTNSVIFISGRSGCGKENIARYIHTGSRRKDGLFVKINCADYDGSAIYSEIYGNKEKGKLGKVFLADKGILYLQNADFMPKQLLADLVRHVRGGKVVFADYSSISMDTRLIFSSKNSNLLTELIGFLRANPGIIPIHVPQVYKTIADISHYARYFTNMYQNENIVDIIFGGDIIKLLHSYSWPGNLTELRSIVRQIVDYYDRFSCVNEEIISEMLSSSFAAYNPDSGKSLKDIENNHISMTVMKYGDSVYEKQQAADELGIGIATLYRKIGYKNN